MMLSAISKPSHTFQRNKGEPKSQWNDTSPAWCIVGGGKNDSGRCLCKDKTTVWHHAQFLPPLRAPLCNKTPKDARINHPCDVDFCGELCSFVARDEWIRQANENKGNHWTNWKQCIQWYSVTWNRQYKRVKRKQLKKKYKIVCVKHNYLFMTKRRNKEK